jgi:protein TonB
VAVSAAIHAGMIAILILVPFVFTDQIEGARLTSFLVAPPPPQSSGPPSVPVEATARILPKTPAAVDLQALMAPPEVPREIAVIVDSAPTGAASVIGGSPIGAIRGVPHGIDVVSLPVLPSAAVPPPAPPTLVAAPPPPPPLPPARSKEPTRISAGVQAGNALFHPSPAYPALAKIARVEGAVIMQALITEDGSIKDLKIVSLSNPLLGTGVIETVKTWKYKPTLLSGEPVEVITTITINFSLGH